MHENGHIYLPEIKDISIVLEENTHRLRELCQSDRINPHSLIRPSYASHQAFGPKHFPDGFDGLQVPDSGTTDWYYTKGQWGYAVPTVGLPQNIDKI
ncbi:MAG: hypothetical protein K2N91_00470 [Muribaculaceae bacterium]|nr:hypothetical protein [Muribaculaceae bacterium]